MTIRPDLLATALGWIATGVVVSSYFFRRARAMRRVQMAGAGIWIAYGVAIGAPPVIAANVLVLAAAAWTTRQRPT